MHKIRQRARQNAWYDESSYNPFGKLPRRPTQGPDQESGPLGESHLKRRHIESAISSDQHKKSHEGEIQIEYKNAGVSSSTTFPKLSKEDRADDNDLTLSNDGGENSNSTSRPKYTFLGQLRATVLNSWLNVLYAFTIAGFIVKYTNRGPITVFAVNFIAIVPSSSQVALAVDELSLRVGEVLGALLSATFSNAVQFITSILLLRSGQFTVLQTSLIGAILSNILLMQGLGYASGGWNRFEQHFNITVAQIMGSILLIAVTSLTIPTVTAILVEMPPQNVEKLSRAAAVILLVIYILYLYFQLKTHSMVYNAPSQKVSKRDHHIGPIKAIGPAAVKSYPRIESPESQGGDNGPENESEEPQLSLFVATCSLVVHVTLLAFNTQFATDSIQALTETTAVSQTFVGIVLLPLLSNDITSVVNATKDHMDLSLALTVGRSLQTALLVTPLTVIIGWIIGKDLILQFQGFEVAATFGSTIIVNYLIADGKSNWLQGVLLVSTFLIVAVAAYFIPDNAR